MLPYQMIVPEMRKADASERVSLSGSKIKLLKGTAMVRYDESTATPSRSESYHQ